MRTENLIHPGEILREEFMIPMGISQNKLAIELRIPATRIGEYPLPRSLVLNWP